jgi:hypothetical protein
VSIENVILQDKGLSLLRKNSLVETTEGCDINPGRFATCTQVHKIRETNFVDLHFNEQGNYQPLEIHFLHENSNVGRVTFFLKK